MKRYKIFTIIGVAFLIIIRFILLPTLQSNSLKIDSPYVSQISKCVTEKPNVLKNEDFWNTQKVSATQFNFENYSLVIGATRSPVILARIYSYEYLSGRKIQNIGTIRSVLGQEIRQVETDKGNSYFILLNKDKIFTEYSPLLLPDDYVFIYITGNSSLKSEAFKIIYEQQKCLKLIEK